MSAWPSPRRAPTWCATPTRTAAARSTWSPRPRGDALEVIVADSGRGLEPSPDTGGPGLGLPLIAALTDTLEIERDASAGSRLVMSFRRNRAPAAIGVA